MDLISADSRRWKLAHPEIPQRTGKINNVNKFDASFFGVHYKQAHTMDPMCRILLEKAYEAIIDAGEFYIKPQAQVRPLNNLPSIKYDIRFWPRRRLKRFFG